MSVLEAHPHAAAVLGAALRDRPSHAYLFHGPAGSGKREAAREFAAELLARDAPDPENARARAVAGVHPDLTWVAPSGAHIMLRGDVDQSVVAAAGHTPFEASYRVFVLERADTMDDPAANTLLKTLEEPPAYVVLILLTDRPTQVLPTVISPLPGVRLTRSRRYSSRAARVARRRAVRRAPARGSRSATASARSRSRSATAPPCAPAPRRSPAPRCAATGRAGPWATPVRRPHGGPGRPRPSSSRALAEELEYLPKGAPPQADRVHRARPPRRPARRDRRLDHALQLVGLWYRDLACLAADAEELVLATDRLEELRSDTPGLPRRAADRRRRAGRGERMRLPFNVSYDLALQALAYRLERRLAPAVGQA